MEAIYYNLDDNHSAHENDQDVLEFQELRELTRKSSKM
jgi:hypothetical protein